ncbi:MAG: cytochrome c [Hyphomicrobiaceae bacterium]|nr:cytochrome c [Hyphomicrobiaceae bacterium]
MKAAVIAGMVGLAATLVGGMAAAQPRLGIGDAAAGRALAERLCATCHGVGAAPADVTSTDVKSFATIARRDGLTAEQLAGHIIIPHPAMPDTQLKVSEIRDIIAYILSLKPKP